MFVTSIKKEKEEVHWQVDLIYNCSESDNFAVPQKLIIGEYKPLLHIAPQGSSGILKAVKEEIYKDGLGFISNQVGFRNDIAKSWS